jgi:hypothetical protein
LVIASGLSAETVPPVVEITTHGGAPFHTCQKKINLKGTFSDPAPSSGRSTIHPRRGESGGNSMSSRRPQCLHGDRADKDGNVAKIRSRSSVRAIYRPVLPDPANALTFLNPILSWSGPTEMGMEGENCATLYQVALDVTNPPESILSEGLTIPSLPAGPLEPATTYYWRVKAKNCCGSMNSEVWSFTTRDLGALSVFHVDDNAATTRAPTTPMSDPLEDGSRSTLRFDQEATTLRCLATRSMSRGLVFRGVLLRVSVYMADGVDLYGGYNGRRLGR